LDPSSERGKLGMAEVLRLTGRRAEAKALTTLLSAADDTSRRYAQRLDEQERSRVVVQKIAQKIEQEPPGRFSSPAWDEALPAIKWSLVAVVLVVAAVVLCSSRPVGAIPLIYPLIWLLRWHA
jgi:hypothetical protein